LKSAHPQPVKRITYIELARAPLAPVDVGLSNPDADSEPVVYIGEPLQSVLKLTLTNQTNSTLVLKGATNVPSDLNNAGLTAAVYLDFGSLLEGSQLAALSVDAGNGWRATFLSDVKLWGLCPAADIAWSANAVLLITVGQIVVSKQAGSAALDVYYVNFDRPDPQFYEARLLIQNPPGNKINANIIAQVDDEIVLITPAEVPPIQNTISIDLINDQPTSLNTGPDTIFYLSFVYGTARGYGALMAKGSAPPDLAIAQPGGDGWDISVDTTGETPYWRLRPRGPVALGTGVANTAVFDISGIVVPSTFVAGPTAIYVQWANLPGYCDGHTLVVLQKRMPKPSVQLDAVANIVDYGSKPILKWSTRAVPHLQLSYSAYGRGKVFLPAADGAQLPLQVPNQGAHGNGFEIPDGIRETTTFYLAAYNGPPAAGQEVQDAPLADASCTVTVQHPTPHIKRFDITPTSWPFELGPTSVILNWEVDWIEIFGGRSLTLNGQTVPPDQTSQTVTNVKGPQTWTLTAQGSGGLFSQGEAELKAQSVTDYLYHPPRRYKGIQTPQSQSESQSQSSNMPSITVTVELILSDINHNTMIISVTPGFGVVSRQTFDAIVEQDLLGIPGASVPPIARAHYRITPGALTFIPTDDRQARIPPITLHEETQ
jgi:hypothetical protein